MNERIKELAKQAISNVKYWDEEFIPGTPGITPPKTRATNLDELEKFAELIVRECAETIQDFVDHRFPASEYPNRLKQYFGVEE